MNIRVRERRRKPDAEDSMFPALPQGTSLYAYALSVWLHASCITGSILIAGLIPPVDPPEKVYRAKALIIRLPKPEHLPEAKPEKETERAEDRADTLRKLADRMVMALRENSAAAATPEAPLQPPRRPAQVEAVLIQPQFPLEMRPPPMSPMVPSILLWPTQLPAAPPEQATIRERALRKVTLPERPPPIAVARLINRDLPPPPLIEQQQSRLNQEGAPAQAVTVLSISDAPMARDTIVVPPGNLIPAAPSNGGEGGRPAPDSPPNADTSKAAPARTAAPVRTTPDRTAPDRTTPSKAAPANAAPGNATPAARPAVPPAILAGKAGLMGVRKDTAFPVADGVAGTRDATVRPSPAAIAELPVNTVPADRLEHPVNGLFDVVIVQTTLDESVPGGANLLHGRPIYTVYLQVGDTKDWILHYCVKDGAIVQRGAVFQLPDPRPVKAPYPRFTYRPAEPVIGPAAYVLVHGLIDEAGALQNLKVIGPIESGTSSLLAALGRWRFRPATRDESPEPVEMVLAIPVRKT